ncbi:MAG: hypothetical protein KDB79_01555 [Acidobacteria bacterium]|nr:hypothetical protein [Acidobacteriota bacterium]
MKKITGFLFLVFLALGVNGSAQVRPPAETSEKETAKVEVPKDSSEKVELAKEAQKDLPKSFKVQYQGGLFGFSKKQDGTIGFDDINERLIFYGEDGKEKFSLPYSALTVVYPSEKKVQSGTGRVVSAIPIMGSGILGGLMKKKKNYLVVQFEDAEVGAKGDINFRLDSSDLVESAINTLGQKAEMKPRGDAYIRSKGY